jgi:uncharacterized protein (TIGR00369 family)
VNPGSPSLRTFLLGDRVVAWVEFDNRQEGAPGLAHGGAVATVLDDVLGTVLLAHQRPAVTARLTVDYVRPVVLGRRLKAESWLVGFEGRKAHVAGFLADGDTVVAEAEALFVCVASSHFEAAGGVVPDEWRAMWDRGGQADAGEEGS